MRLRVFIAECMLLCVTIASACGPFYNDISYPLTCHFYQGENSPELSNIQYKRNISSWQRITSYKISSGDIAATIYKLSLHSLQKNLKGNLITLS